MSAFHYVDRDRTNEDDQIIRQVKLKKKSERNTQMHCCFISKYYLSNYNVSPNVTHNNFFNNKSVAFLQFWRSQKYKMSRVCRRNMKVYFRWCPSPSPSHISLSLSMDLSMFMGHTYHLCGADCIYIPHLLNNSGIIANGIMTYT